MSIKAIAWAFEQDVPPTTKLVLLKLADNANDEGLCWPAQSTLSRHTGLARETVNRHVKKLEQLGILKIRRRSKEGVSLPNHYLLNLRGVVTENHRGSDSESHGVVTEDHTEPSGSTVSKPNGQTAPDRFREFWEAYPKKRDRKKARDAWKRKRLDSRADQIIADVKRRVRNDDQWLKGYVPHATTYINGERWEDEINSGPGSGPTAPHLRTLS